MITDARMNNQNSSHSIKQIRIQSNDFKSCLQSYVSCRIIKSRTVIRGCNTKKNIQQLYQGRKLCKKNIRNSQMFRQNMVNGSCPWVFRMQEKPSYWLFKISRKLQCF